jgi:pyrroloquinoline quinone (PQQ) biosynthesis protein C
MEPFPMPFFDTLQAATQAERATLFQAPVIRDCLAGRVTRAQYLAFLTQAYHHVRHTVPLLIACGARLPARHDALRRAVAHYIDEEIGHEDWILSDIAASGGDAKMVRASQPGAAAELMVAYAYDTIARHRPVGFFGMVHVLEGTSTALATEAARMIGLALDLPAQAFSYLTSHGSLDISHVRFFAELMNDLDDPDDQASVMHVSRMMYKLYGDVFRSLPAYDEVAVA